MSGKGRLRKGQTTKKAVRALEKPASRFLRRRNRRSLPLHPPYFCIVSCSPHEFNILLSSRAGPCEEFPWNKNAGRTEKSRGFPQFQQGFQHFQREKLLYAVENPARLIADCKTSAPPKAQPPLFGAAVGCKPLQRGDALNLHKRIFGQRADLEGSARRERRGEGFGIDLVHGGEIGDILEHNRCFDNTVHP